MNRKTAAPMTPLERRLRRGGERVRYSFSSLVAGGATWFAPGVVIQDTNTPPLLFSECVVFCISKILSFRNFLKELESRAK